MLIRHILLMQFISFIAANALLFASLILVVGVPVLYMTQKNPEDRRNPEIKRIELIGGVWFHLVLLNGVIAEYVAHQIDGVTGYIGPLG